MLRFLMKSGWFFDLVSFELIGRQSIQIKPNICTETTDGSVTGR